MSWNNSTDLVRYALAHHKALKATGKDLSSAPELPTLEPLGAVAGVNLTRVGVDGCTWLEATCDVARPGVTAPIDFSIDGEYPGVGDHADLMSELEQEGYNG